MCHCDGETVNHLLLHCNVMAVLWTFVFRSLGYSVCFRGGWWKLVWEAFFRCLEFSSFVFDVDSLAGTK